jgi:hypothetical protein
MTTSWTKDAKTTTVYTKEVKDGAVILLKQDGDSLLFQNGLPFYLKTFAMYLAEYVKDPKLTNYGRHTYGYEFEKTTRIRFGDHVRYGGENTSWIKEVKT